MPTWRFARHRALSKQRDPIQGEFFTADSIKSTVEALVRESVQNSLDATVEPPARVRILVAGGDGALPAAVVQPYLDGLPSHLQACGTMVRANVDAPCRFVVVEDFGTTGLRGDEAQSDEPSTGHNDFFYFFRAEGRSGKGDADRGRWGIGKYVFPMVSGINTFFALTMRDARTGDTPGPFLMGQAILKNHTIPGQGSYEPDGWWARLVDGVPLPVDDEGEIARFREVWRLERRDEPGLSVVIPYVDSDVDAQAFTEAVVRHYFIAVLAGQLTVDVVESVTDTTRCVSAETLDDVIAQLPDDAPRRDLERNVELTRWGLANTDEQAIRLLPAPPGARLSAEAMTPEDRERARTALARGERIVVRVPVCVERRDQSAEESHFDVLLGGEPDYRGNPIFAREGLIISELRSPATVGVRAIALVRDEPLVRMLGDAEGPAHTGWSARTAKFRGQYARGRDWISFIKTAPAAILSIIHGEDDKQDRTIAVDYFSIPSEPTDGSGGDPIADGNGNRPPPPKPPPQPAREPRLRVSALTNGFSVRMGPADGDDPVLTIDVDAAYDRRRGDPFKHWEHDDFELTNMAMEVAGGHVVRCAENHLTVAVDDPTAFELKVRGFDGNRDLRVSARARTTA